MLSPSMLPPALLELTFLRLTGPLSTARAIHGAHHGFKLISATRQMHQAALATAPPPFYNYSYTPNNPEQGIGSEQWAGIKQVRSGQVVPDTSSELERRVKALEEAAEAEASALEPPSYTEEQLLAFYEDLLALPIVEESKVELDPATVKQAQLVQDMSTINAAHRRLQHSARITQRDVSLGGSAGPLSFPNLESSTQPYQRVLSYAHGLISRIDAARATSLSQADGAVEQRFVPVAVLSSAEYASIVRVCIQSEDVEATELALNLMKRSGMSIPETITTHVMEMYANNGNVRELEGIMAKYLTGYPTERQRHLHITAHIVATPSELIPTSALEALHSYESQAHPAPIHTYTSLITSLFSTNTSIGRAQAWDLFSHMRYVAHSEPDVALYTLMIRACASPLNMRSSEPEKALDLWTEMTVDRRLDPTAGAYDAIILACARSGSTVYVNEAFRLAKQMLDTHRDARGNSAFTPSRRTFCALLEGAKRIGDLARARWILAEMISDRRGEAAKNEREGVNEEVMMHIFHTYASYRPPFKRTAVLSVKENAVEPQQTTNSQPGAPVSHPDQTEGVSTYDRTPSFTHIPPQSHAEVINEVTTLYDRILLDTGLKTDVEETGDGVLPTQEKFKDVLVTPRLLNSYLSVHYKHSSLETSRALYCTIFEECSVSRTGRTYVEALERCAIAKRGHERKLALQFAEEVWAQWKVLEDAGKESLSGRIIERAHIAMIRVLALTGNVDRAYQHVKAFASRYPPSDIRTPFPKPALRSTRTVLVGQRPLVRLTSNVEVPDDHVPPLLMFGDLEILHHRLVAMEARAEIGYISYICKAYEGALRVRRDTALNMKPEKLDSGRVPRALASS